MPAPSRTSWQRTRSPIRLWMRQSLVLVIAFLTCADELAPQLSGVRDWR
jgi:hypothetical protein